jgi:hypothetical protein
MTCPLCRQRKGKRACPARGAAICSQCCGTKRLVEIACPSDCPYLTGAHAPGWEGRAADRERDHRRLGPHVGRLPERQLHLVLIALAGIAGTRARQGELDDSLLLEAVVALRKTVDTRVSGVLYEHPAGDARARELVQELAGVFEARDDQGAVQRPADTDLATALRALEEAIAATLRENDGPRAFLDTATRLAGRLGAAPAAPPRPLIVEP